MSRHPTEPQTGAPKTMETNRPFRFELLPQDASDSLIDLLTDEQLQRDEISPELDDAVSRGLSATLAFSTAQREENRIALKVLAELGAEPDFDRRVGVLERQTFKTSGLCLLLIDESQQQSHSDPAAGLEMARLALCSAELIDPVLVGDRVHQDLKAEAWTAMAAAHTARAEYLQAEQDFEKAEALLEAGSGTLVPRGVVLAQKARLRIEQRRFEESQRLVDQALPIYRTASNAASLGDVLLIKGRLLEFQEQGEQAEDCFREALDLALCAGSQELQLSAQFRLAALLFAKGRARESDTLLEKTLLLATALGRRLDRAHILWLQAKVRGGLPRPRRATELLRRARHGFLGAGCAFEAAQVDLDLCAFLLGQGDLAALRQAANEMEVWQDKADLPTSMASAMALLRQAAARGNLETGLVESLASFLRGFRAHPGQTFSYP